METKMDSMQTSIDYVKKLSSKVDSIEDKVGSMLNSIQEIHVLRDKLDSTAKLSNHANLQAEENKDNMGLLQQRIKSLEAELQTVTVKSDETKRNLTTTVSQLHEENAKLDSYMRRDNLLFLKIPESPTENCELLVRNVLKNLKIDDPMGIKITRCHRLKYGNCH